MSEWKTAKSAPMNEWLLGWGLFDSEDKPASMRLLRRVAPNGRGGQYGDFVWAEPDAPHVGKWAEMIVKAWHPLPDGPGSWLDVFLADDSQLPA